MTATNQEQAAPTRARVPRARNLTVDRVAELLRELEKVNTVELKLSVPDSGLRSAVQSLGMDPLDAEIRQAAFLDTPDLTLNGAGMAVRVRRVQRKPGDAVVTLRPIDPSTLPTNLRESPAGGVELAAMPGGYVVSATMKGKIDDVSIRDAWAGRLPVRKLFTKQQRAFYKRYAPEGLAIDDLSLLGPVTLLKLKFTPPDFDRRLVAELWHYPDGSRILELSTKCLPAEAFTAAADTRAFLVRHGIDVTGAQQTKTKTALNFFAKQLSADRPA